MILDLSPIVNNEGKRLELDFVLDMSQNECGICFKMPVEVHGTLVNIGGCLELSAKANAVLELTCDRCLEGFEKPIECAVEEVLKKEDVSHNDQNPDAVYFKGNTIELDELVLNNIFLSLPIKNLCSEECKGLCPECGRNLNNEKCSCDTRTSDPRFDVLDKFF